MSESSGTQPEIDSVETEIQEPKKPNANASKNDHDKYRRDMLKFKDEAAKLREQLNAYELKEQEQKGDFTKVIQKLKEENKNLKTQYGQERYNYAFSKVEDSVKNCALKLGCKDPDTFFKLIDAETLRAIEVDKSFKPNMSEIESIVGETKSKYEHLGFFEKKVNIVDKAPNGGATFKGSAEKSINDMTKDELLAYAKKIGMKTLK